MATVTSPDRDRWATGSGDGARRGSTNRPAARLAAVVLTFVEAGALLGVAVWWGTAAVRGAGVRGSEVFLIAFALGVALVLAAAARSLALGRRGARGPVVTWQVLQAVTATTVLGVPQARVWAGLAIALSVALVALLMTPGVAVVPTGARSSPPEPG